VIRLAILGAFLVSTAIAGVFAFPTSHLSVSFLDVGQGDAILIQGPTGVQVLVDGGVNQAVLRQLGRELPFYDRSIDAVIATHSDQDHIGGLRDVVERYSVEYFFESGAQSNTSAERVLHTALEKKGVSRTLARKGMRMLLGGGAYIDILFPDRDVSGLETNTASIVARVVYGDAEFLLTGDSPQSIERFLVASVGDTLESDVLKAGHHGSKTSSSLEFVRTVRPQYVVISAGKDNSYGHPHQEVIDTIRSVGATILGTHTHGTVKFFSDGRRVWR